MNAPSRGGRTPVEVRPFPLAAPELVRDLLRADAAVAPFYAGHPFDLQAFQRKAAAVAQRLNAEARRRVEPALRTLSEDARDRVDRILGGDGFLVTTGQQAGLFGGPLYTIIKILCAIRLAETLNASLDAPVLALFWAAADDHDWAEVDHVAVVDPSNELRRIVLAQPENAPPFAMADRVLGPGIEAALASLEAAMPTSEFSGDILDLVRTAYRPDATMAGAFETLIAGLFDGHPLAMISSAHPSVRQAAQPLILRDVERAAAHAAVLNESSRRLEERGYHAQVTIREDAANVFLHGEQGRDRLLRRDGAWILSRTKRRIEDDALHRLLENHPDRFSPNVLLRPIVESAILPTLAYVGGGAEISYFAQIGVLFAEHGIEPPLAYPRTSMVIVESRVRRVLDKFGLDVEDFLHPFHEVAARVLRDEMPDEVNEAGTALRTALRDGYDRLAEVATRVDPTLERWIGGVRNGALADADGALKKIESHFRKRHEVELEQLRKAAVNLFPDGQPQERVLSPLPFLARYGRGLLDDIRDAVAVQWIEPEPVWSSRDDG